MPADRDPLAEPVKELVRRCLNGDSRAAAQLVERFEQQVFALCYRMLGQREDAEDVAQESLLRALRSLKTWDENRDFVPWLLAIAGNRCRTMLAARARRPRTVSEIDYAPDPTPSPDAVRHLAEEVEQALTHVRAEYRQAFLLFHEQELSYAEIAEVLNCPIGTVKTWVHRARRDLIDRLRSRDVISESKRALRGL